MKIFEYITLHWKGKHSLARAWWINYFLINAICTAIIVFFLNYSDFNDPRDFIKIHYFILFFMGGIQIWQLVGLTRCCLKTIKNDDKYLWPTMALLVVIINVLNIFNIYNENGDSITNLIEVVFQDDQFSNFKISLINNNEIIEINGPIGYELPERVEKILQSNSTVKGILMNSEGGWAYSGVKLAEIIKKYNLNTYVTDYCLSACTYAFISGKERFLGRSARIGFHDLSSGLRDKYTRSHDSVDLKNKIIRLFEEKNIENVFLSQIFNAPHNDMWYPSINLMFDSGVVTGFVDGSMKVKSDQLYSVKQIEAELLRYSIYQTIKQYDSELYDFIVNKIKNLIDSGQSESQIAMSTASIINVIVSKAASITSTSNLINYFRTEAKILSQLQEIEPFVCVQYIYPDRYGEFDISKYIPNWLVIQMIDAKNNILLDAYTGRKNNKVITSDESEILLTKIIFDFQFEEKYLLAEDLKGYGDYMKTCNIFINIQNKILSLEEDKAIGIIKLMLTEPLKEH